MASTKLKNLLNPCGNGDLADMVGRAQAMGELTERLQDKLPAQLADSVVAANINADGRLIVIAKSPAWAARLRFEADTMIGIARTVYDRVDGCSVRVSHDLASDPSQ